jgi:hypothetical protein
MDNSLNSILSISNNTNCNSQGLTISSNLRKTKKTNKKDKLIDNDEKTLDKCENQINYN